MATAILQASTFVCTSRSAERLTQERPSVVASSQQAALSRGHALRSSLLHPLRTPVVPLLASSTRAQVLSVVAEEEKAFIEFIRGLKERTVPEVRLTRSRDGSSGTATFIFEQPSVFEQSTELGDITGLYMIDEEGIMQSVEVSARFVNGRPSAIEARYIMRSEREWDRFMRFMERYAEAYGLGFTQK